MNEPVINYDACPGCGSPQIQSVLGTIDYTVTKKQFEIWQCGVCSLRFTQHVPAAEAIHDYYRSDTYISHTNTKKGLINQLYHLVRKRTLSGKRKLIVSSTKIKSGSLLDIGAGTGAFVRHMQQSGWLVTGLEPDENAREQALVHHGVKLLTPMSMTWPTCRRILLM